MSLSIKGTVKQKLDLEQGTSKFEMRKSQSFVLNTGVSVQSRYLF